MTPYVVTMPPTVSAGELNLRRDRMAGFIAAWGQSPRRRDVAEVMAERKNLSPPLLELLGRFMSEDVDAPAFRDGTDEWSRGKPVFGFGGPAGSMFLNQVVNDGAESAREVSSSPAAAACGHQGSVDACCDELAAFVEELRQSGSAAAVGRCPFFLTWFWSLQEPSWRPMWPSCDKALQKLAWTTSWPETQGQRLEEYDQVLEKPLGGRPPYRRGLDLVGLQRPPGGPRPDPAATVRARHPAAELASY